MTKLKKKNIAWGIMGKKGKKKKKKNKKKKN